MEVSSRAKRGTCFSACSTPLTSNSADPSTPLRMTPVMVRTDGRSFRCAEHVRPGSNNWVISGAHTASGKPLLSNDMHLLLELPNVWYEAHLSAGDFDVAGVTLPGVPVRNRRAQPAHRVGLHEPWAQRRRHLHRKLQRPRASILRHTDGLQPEHRKEIIRVKGKSEITLDVVTTRHGPIISELLPGEQRKLALKWTIYDPQAISNVVLRG